MHGPATSARIGQPVTRKEDRRFVTGEGHYADDFNFENQTYAIMVRSPHAHANIVSIDASEALAVPGVLAVLTGADFIADGLLPVPNKTFSMHPAEIPLVNTDGTPAFNVPDYPMPADKARFVGEPLVMVIAESIAAAKDGADLVHIEYEPLPCVTFTVDAADLDAPRVRDENTSNVCIDAVIGEPDPTEESFRNAAHIAKVKTWIPRVTGSPMEPRGAVGTYDPKTGQYTVYTSSGSTLRLRRDLSLVLNVPEPHVRLVIKDVGGNFGTRGAIFAEQPLVAWAAKRVGRPVKWTSERSELLLSDYQGRDLAVEAELALDKDGTFLAMRGSNVGNLGSHTGNFSMVQKGVEIMSSIYRMPSAFFRVRAVLSHTAPTRPYRSSGRPEVMYVMERLIDIAAKQGGFDRAELRLRNLVSQNELPYKNPFGLVYDSGDYIGVMHRTLKLADWEGFPARKAEARTRGKYRGMGLANYVDTATGIPREKARITVHPDGTTDLIIGTISNGQGHETSFAQLVHDWLSVPFEKVKLITGDTDIVDVGGGAHSGRGMRLGSIVIWEAVNRIIEKGKQVVGLLLQKDAAAIKFADGDFFADGNQVMSLIDVATAMNSRTDLPQEFRGPLAGECDQTIMEAGFPYGSHACEVEIDIELGTVEIVRHTAIDDVGRAVNPLIIHGQTHGGIAQGVGQALLEQVYYDASNGQMLAGSFMDYAMPRADMLPFYTTDISEIPSTTHPLGIRPAGEGGTTPALGVVINAIVDALSEFGVEHMEMPATPERIWRAIHGKPQRSRMVPDTVEQDFSLA
ncbi:MAG TPA: xanthine dehydrogenase family protein molybdopterin-binding subunit [Xanthobacteraceae bacterium]|jgi:carbon-monoxide dehydrogenase large subunit|nr:xanthine dehydrogenase family protein molybdopterin-binding subunit [Xanthobacteraceae bacterium]